MTCLKHISKLPTFSGGPRSAFGMFGVLLLGFHDVPAHALEDPGLRGGSAFAEWDVFADASGGDNAADAGLGGSLGFSTAPVLRQINPDANAFITSSGSIYSFSGISRFEIEGSFAGELNNLVLQFTSLGAEIDYGSILFSHGPDYSSTFAPTSAAPTATAPGEVTYLAQWDFSALRGLTHPFKISFDAAGSSVSLAAARIDISDTFDSVAPTAPILVNQSEYLAYAEALVSIQLEATGDPFLYSASDLPPWLSIDNSTGLIRGTVPEGTTGFFSFSATAFNGQISDPVELSLTTVVPQSYASWASSASLAPAEGGSMDDPDGDGLTNLEEYFFGTDPLVPDASASIGSLDYVREAGQPDWLVLSFNWNLRAADVQVTLESANASFAWSSDAAGTELKLFNDGTAEASLITEDSASGFLRLNLSF